jgi:hypothetical protein
MPKPLAPCNCTLAAARLLHALHPCICPSNVSSVIISLFDLMIRLDTVQQLLLAAVWAERRVVRCQVLVDTPGAAPTAPPTAGRRAPAPVHFRWYLKVVVIKRVYAYMR